MRTTVALSLALTVALLATPVGAEVSKPDLSAPQSDAAFVSGVAAPVVPSLVDVWGFEASEGFAPGYIGGQAGWTAFVASATQGAISTANPSGGAQHLRISKDAAIASGTLTGAFSPDRGPQGNVPSTMCVDIAIGATGGADYDVVPQAPSQGFLTARVKFSWLGNILILDDPGAGLAFVDTGTAWNVGPYTQLCIVVDPVADTIDYYYGGSLLYSSVAGVFAGTQMEQVVLISDNFQLGESGDFDNLAINTDARPPVIQEIPTLGSAALAVLAALLLATGTIFLVRRRA